jgi:hypothetical protein
MKMTENETVAHRIDNLLAERDAAHRLLGDALDLMGSVLGGDQTAIARARSWAPRMRAALDRAD